MGRVEPPVPLTREQFNKAIAEGRSTFAEIDPEYCAWYKAAENEMKLGYICVVLGYLVIFIILIQVLN
jgi:hypothetical protein